MESTSAFCIVSKSRYDGWSLRFIRKSETKHELSNWLTNPHHYVCHLTYDSDSTEFYVHFEKEPEIAFARGQINNLLTTRGLSEGNTRKYIKIPTKLVKEGNSFFLYDQAGRMDSVTALPVRKDGSQWILINGSILAVSVGSNRIKIFYHGSDNNLYSSPYGDGLHSSTSECYYERPLETPDAKKRRKQRKDRLKDSATTFAVILKTQNRGEKLMGLFSSLDKANEYVQHSQDVITNYATQKLVVRPMEGDLKLGD